MVEVCAIQHLMCVWGSKRNFWAVWCADFIEVGFEVELCQVGDARLMLCGKYV